MTFIKNNSSGFTLVELMIAMTIFGMMIIMMMSIYLSTTDTTRRLNAQRELAETAREITERISADISEKGFSGSAGGFDVNYDPWKSYNYSGSGSEYLNLMSGRYVYGIKNATGMEPCTPTKQADASIHCGLYFVEYSDNGTSGYNLVDSFNPVESRKRVRIEDLSFYVSGDGISTSRKVTMNFTLTLVAGRGVSTSLANSTRLHIQTTFSERSWKK